MPRAFNAAAILASVVSPVPSISDRQHVGGELQVAKGHQAIRVAADRPPDGAFAWCLTKAKPVVG
jgi:hypothetical protein